MQQERDNISQLSRPFGLRSTNTMQHSVENPESKLVVQRTAILRDSLEQAPPDKSERILKTFENQAPTTATVETEEGEILEVIFDPVLNSYFDPKS